MKSDKQGQPVYSSWAMIEFGVFIKHNGILLESFKMESKSLPESLKSSNSLLILSTV